MQDETFNNGTGNKNIIIIGTFGCCCRYQGLTLQSVLVVKSINKYNCINTSFTNDSVNWNRV